MFYHLLTNMYLHDRKQTRAHTSGFSRIQRSQQPPHFNFSDATGGGAVVQRQKAPTRNEDILEYDQGAGGQFHLKDADKQLLLQWQKEMTEVLEKASGTRYTHDLRWLLVIAMRFTEQAGKASARKPAGNNPFNIMGSGPAGSFNRPNNKEEVDGESVTQAADFAKYHSDAQGTAAFFGILGDKWDAALQALLAGGSVEDFASGLRPKGKLHYLTKNKPEHIKNLKIRVNGLIYAMTSLHQDQIKSTNDEINGLVALTTYLRGAMEQGSLEDRKARFSDWKVLTERIARLRAYLPVLQANIQALAEAKARMDKGEALQSDEGKEQIDPLEGYCAPDSCKIRT